MKLKIDKKEIKIVELNGFFNKFKGLKFVFEPIKDGYKFKSKYANTYFLCQKIDIVMTNIDNKILYIYKNVKPEKIILPKFRVNYVYFLPSGTADNLKLEDTLEITK